MNKLRIKKLGILSVAKIYAVMGLVFGLLIGVPYGGMIIVFSLIGAGGAGGDAALAIGGGGIVMGLVIMILIPVGYAVMAFISGVIGALIYNIFAAMVGGVEIEVENVY